MGRPTKYKPEFCQRLMRFFEGKPFRDVKLHHYKGKGENREVVWTDIKRMANKLPTLVEFAKSIKVCYATVYNWQDEKHPSFHREFLESFTRAKELQKNFLLQNGLLGLYNPIFAKFVAVNITDMTDKQVKELDETIRSDVVEPEKAEAYYERKLAELKRQKLAGTALAG